MTRKDQLEMVQKAIAAWNGEKPAELESLVRTQKLLLETPDEAFEAPVKMELSLGELQKLLEPA